MIKKSLIVIALLAVGLFIGLVVAGSNTQPKSVGGTVENFPTKWINGLYVGASGDLLANAVHGTCSITGLTTVATSSISKGTCVTGESVTYGDVVLLQAASSSPWGWFVVGGSASTTVGTIDVAVYNNSATTTPPAAFKANLQYWVIR